MPAADDPVARLHGRAACDAFFEQVVAHARPGQGFPRVGGRDMGTLVAVLPAERRGIGRRG